MITVIIKRQKKGGGRGRGSSDGPLSATLFPNGFWHQKAPVIPTHPWLTSWKAHKILSLFSSPFIYTGWIQENFGLSCCFPQNEHSSVSSSQAAASAMLSCEVLLLSHSIILWITAASSHKFGQKPVPGEKLFNFLSLPLWPSQGRVFLKHCTVSKACGYCSVYNHKSLHSWISGAENGLIFYTPVTSCLLEMTASSWPSN